MKPSVQDIHALAPSQRGMLVESALDGTRGGLFIEQSVLSVRGELDASRFNHAVERTAEIHASLRCCFAWDAERPVQVVFNKIRSAIVWEDWRGREAADIPRALSAWLDEDRARGVAINRAPLWRFTVIRLRDDDYRIIWTHHHLITDGWSIAVVLSDLLQHYTGSRQVPSARPFRCYIDWIDTQDKTRAGAFWRQRVGALPRVPLLNRRATSTGFAEIVDIDMRGAIETARAHGVAFAVVAFAAWALVLRATRSSDEVVFGITVHGRPASLAGVERIVGPFIATFPLHLKIADMTATGDLLRQIDSLQREQQPFEYLSAAEIHQISDLAMRLYDSLVVVEQIPQQTALADQGISVSAESGSGARSHHPLLLRASSHGTARLLYNQKFVDDETAAGLASLLVQAADQMASNDVLPRLDSEPISCAPARSTRSRDPETREEQVVLALARNLFGDCVSLDDNFIDLGGHSLLAIDFIDRIAIATGVKLPITQFLQDARLGAVAEALRDSRAGVAVSSLQPRIFFVPGNPGSPLYASGLATHLTNWRLHGVEAPGLNGRQTPLTTVEALAEHHLTSLSESDDPAVIVGHSFGGWVAFEMGLRLQAQGRAAAVILLDTVAPHRLPSRGDVTDAGLQAEVARLTSRAGNVGLTIQVTSAAFATYAAARRATYAPCGRATFQMALFRAARSHPEDNWDKADPAYGWGELCSNLHVESIDGDHLSIMMEPAVVVLAQRIERWLQQLD